MAGFEDWIWESDTVWAAELDARGAVVRSNAALGRAAGDTLRDVVVPEQHPTVDRRIAEAGPDWTAGPLTVLDPASGSTADRRLYLRRDGERLLAVAEPAAAELLRLAGQMLELNTDLLEQQRRLVREREALDAERRAAERTAERLRQLERIATAALSGTGLDELLAGLLEAIRAAVGADRAAVLVRAGENGPLLVRASRGEGPAVELPAELDLDRPYLLDRAAGVPLRNGPETLGVLHVAADRPAPFGEPDLGLLQAAGDRAALAIARAQVYEREHRIAETLQRSLLPAELPAIDGLRMGARFEPGAGVDVGGDWYDAVPLPSGDLGLVIGDVAGKGLRAASLMGEVRSVVRAYAMELGEPQDVLASVNRVVERAGAMVTCSLAVLVPATGAFRVASAGHPPALVLRAGGAAEFVAGGRQAPLLAYEPDTPAAGVLGPGDRVLLYTDGLIERRGETLDHGLERLRRTAAAAREADWDELFDHLLATVPPPEGQRDDAALLGVERAL